MEKRIVDWLKNVHEARVRRNSGKIGPKTPQEMAKSMPSSQLQQDPKDFAHTLKQDLEAKVGPLDAEISAKLIPHIKGFPRVPRKRERGTDHLPVGVVRADSVAPGQEVRVYSSGADRSPFIATIESMVTPLAQPKNPAVTLREGHGRRTIKSSIAGATKVKPV